MKKSLIVLFLLIYSSVFAQNKAIEYAISDADGIGILILSDTVSYWQEFYENTGFKADGTILQPSNNKIYLVKNLKNQFIYHSNIVFGKNFDVIDSLHQMKWKLGKLKKEILGFPCKSATTTFRGRAYTAYYTTKIAVSNGPWKFGGLPGLILEVTTKDKDFNFVATKITDAKNYKIEPIPFEKNKFITWNEYVKKFEDVVKARIERAKADMKPGESGSLFLGRREIIYPPIQTGEGIKF